MDGRWRAYLVVASRKSKVQPAAKRFEYVAFTEPVGSFEAARRLAAFWADAAESYNPQARKLGRRKAYWINPRTDLK